MTKTVSALYDNHEDALAAVDQLEAAGIPRSDISIVANNSDNWYDRDGRRRTDGDDVGEDAAAGAGLGAAIGGAGGLLAGLGMLAIPGIGPVVAAGWLAATAAGAAAGAVAGGAVGGLVGSLTAEGVPEEEAQVYAEGVRRGGTLVSARVPDFRASEAQAILDQNRVDWTERQRDYRAGGWTGFDESAAGYSADDVSRERQRYTTL